MTATGSTAPGYVKVWKAGTATPGTSNLNYATGQTVANLVVVQVGTGGAVNFLTSAKAQLIADVSGYYVGSGTTFGTFAPVTTSRLMDTRLAQPAAEPAAGATTTLKVTGGAVPPSASAVVLNVTATGSTAPGYVTVWQGGALPTASSLNFARGQTVANLVVVPVGLNGEISFFTSARTQLVADISGYYVTGAAPTVPGTYAGTPSTRLLDTRRALGGTAPAAHQTVPLQVGGVSAGGTTVPTGVTAVVLNVTVTAPTAAGYITAWAGSEPGQRTQPTASNLNFARGQTVANLVVAPVSPDGTVDLYASAGTQLIADLVGYFVPDTTPPNPVTALSATPQPISAGTASVALTWTNPTTADFAGVTICRAVGTTAPASTCVQNGWLTDTGPTTTTFTDAAVAQGTQYTYALFAFDSSENLAAAATATVRTFDTTPPGPVTNVLASPTPGTVTVTWTNPTDADFAGTTICRAAGSTAPSSACLAGSAKIGTTVAPATSYADTTAVPNTQYSYSVFAQDTSGNYSLVASALPITSSAALPNVPGPILEPTASNVTADPLPTVQIDGVAWTQVIVGNTVFVGGDFDNAFPYHTANTQANYIPRTDLLAYNLTTGVLISSFNPVLNGQVLSLAVSADGSTIYAGGDFTTVNGVTHNRLAAFNVATGQLVSTFTPNIDASVRAVVTTSSAVYAGGSFTTADGVARASLAAFDPTTGALLAWAPAAQYRVNALVVAPGGGSVVVGGSFLQLNGQNVYGMGAVDATTGASLPWAINQTLQDYTIPSDTNGTGSAVLSLSTDGTAIYGSGYNYGVHRSATWEGVFSANPSTGALNWYEDCHGDSYDTFPVSGIVYVVSHEHFCSDDGGWPNSDALAKRSTAFTATATGRLLPYTQGGNYNSFGGTPAPSIYNWFPDFLTGTVTGQGQAAWTVTGNSTYVVEGGEFPAVNNGSQYGLTRFAIRGTTGNPGTQGPRLGPVATSSSPAWTAPSVSSTSRGVVKVSFGANWDRDDLTMSYTVTRTPTAGGTAQVVSSCSQTANSLWWNLKTLNCTDTTATPGASYTYTVTASDPHGDAVAGPPSSSVTVHS